MLKEYRKGDRPERKSIRIESYHILKNWVGYLEIFIFYFF